MIPRQTFKNETPEEKAERLASYKRKYYEANKAKCIQRVNDWRKANPQKHAEHRQSEQSNRRAKRLEAGRGIPWGQGKGRDPEKRKKSHHAATNAHRCRKKKAEGSHTQAEWESLCKKHGMKCLACGETGVKLTKDHVVPLSKGGTDYITNIQPLCGACNGRKWAKEVDYRPQYGGYDIQTGRDREGQLT